MMRVWATWLVAATMVVALVRVVAGQPTPTPPGPPPATQTPTPTPTATPVHQTKDPRKNPWPKITDMLTVAERDAIKALIDKGEKQKALDQLVAKLKKLCCNFGDINGDPKYEPNDPSKGGIEGEGAFNTETKVVRIGNDAFSHPPSHPPRPGEARITSVAWLYCTIKHELVHAAQWRDPKAAEKMGDTGRDYEAYRRQLANAENCGISKAEKDDLIERCKEASRLRNDPNCK